jgi:cytidine deaminase
MNLTKSSARDQASTKVLPAEHGAQLEDALSSPGGYVPAAVVAAIVKSGVSIDELMLALVPRAKEYAIPPISNFKVGAVALGTSGSLYFGANFEYVGEALSLCVHGEQAATAHAISYGETGLQKLAVSAAPCGYCRQFLYELSTAATLSVLVSGAPAASLTSLLPLAFGPGDLGVEAALMSPQAHGLTLVESDGSVHGRASPDALVEAALVAANASYAPYSFSYSGVALKTASGAFFAGSYAENAAYNPSMAPLEAALVSLVIRGGAAYTDVVDAVLVEVVGAKASCSDVTRAVLRSISGVELRVRGARVLVETGGQHS